MIEKPTLKSSIVKSITAKTFSPVKVLKDSSLIKKKSHLNEKKIFVWNTIVEKKNPGSFSLTEISNQQKRLHCHCFLIRSRNGKIYQIRERKKRKILRNLKIIRRGRHLSKKKVFTKNHENGQAFLNRSYKKKFFSVVSVNRCWTGIPPPPFGLWKAELIIHFTNSHVLTSTFQRRHSGD